MNSIPEEYRLSSYMYDLPEELIAQEPCAERGGDQLLVLERRSGACSDALFSDLPTLLDAGALLVVNNSRVLPARLLGRRATGGKVEFLLLTPLPLVVEAAKQWTYRHNRAHVPPDVLQALGETVRRYAGRALYYAEVEGLLKASKRIQQGQVFHFGSRIAVEVGQAGERGRHTVRLFWQGDLAECFLLEGCLPLPPYIRRTVRAEDAERYQTIYSHDENLGSVAAPTAGLHFTPEIREALLQKGCLWEELTLHVGYGTFSPVHSDDIREHVMHAEYVQLPESTVNAIHKAKAEKRPIVAVGTTATRVLEGVAARFGGLEPYTGWINAFIYPGAKSAHFQIVDQLLTNFHLPASSLIMLVSALAGRQKVLDAYSHAVQRKYRFFSYGDAMLIR